MIAQDVKLGAGVVIHQPDLVNLYGCTVGDGSRIGAFVEVQKQVLIGANCKISSHTFICSGVTIEDGAFVGHGVMFINDLYPRAVNEDGGLQTEADWQMVATRIKPYYLHHLDRAPGTTHFHTTVAHGQELMDALRMRFSGLCQPSYVIDTPGEGKVPISARGRRPRPRRPK